MYPYDTFNMSIGQGSNEYTVMQLANYVATIANGGKRMQPYLVQKIAFAGVVEYNLRNCLNKHGIVLSN